MDAVITDRIQALCGTIVWRKDNKIQSLGAKSRENLLSKWKSMRWKFQLREGEFATIKEHVIAATSAIGAYCYKKTLTIIDSS